MIAVTADDIDAIKKSIEAWQHGLESTTGLATAFAVLAVVFERSRRSRIAFGILSGIFWATTILCSSEINTKTSRLQNIYATQTEDAENRIATLKPKVDCVKSTVDKLDPLVNDHLKPTVDKLQGTVSTLTPKVNHLDEQIKSLQPKVSVLVNNENRITDFRIEVFYPVVGQRMENTEQLPNTYHAARRDGPVLRCVGFSLPLYPSSRHQRDVGANTHINEVDYLLINRDKLIGKPITNLDSCDMLSIRITDLEVENVTTWTTHKTFESISSMGVRIVINQLALPAIQLTTPPLYWQSRIEDAGFITLDLKNKSRRLSEQFADRYASSAGTADHSQ